MARKKPGDSFIDWHSAFYEAIQLELAQFAGLLEFKSETPLNTAPLRIDLLIIKKSKQTVISKNIAAIFRSVNIVEYKSPSDYVSVDDFYKVYGYTCLYAALERIPITECTITFVESRHPRELLAHFKEVRHYGVEEKSPGIYTISGDIIPIQIIESKRLLSGGNLWLKDLDNRLDTSDIWRVAAAIKHLGKGAKAEAYLDAIIRANHKETEEVLEMNEMATALLQKVERVERLRLRLVAEAKAEGITEDKLESKLEGKLEVAQKLLEMGTPLKKVAEATGFDTETLKSLYPQKKVRPEGQV
jgi:hypothetical protein